jgi:hypothetical protein
VKSVGRFGPILVYLFLDTLCVGAGMGVPIFAILIGFAVGWFLPRFLPPGPEAAKPSRKSIFRAAFLFGGFTFALMAILWLPALPMLWNSQADLANFGIPLLLFEPRASFIAWELLMIVISPFLQVLAIIFGADLRLLFGEEAARKS